MTYPATCFEPVAISYGKPMATEVGNTGFRGQNRVISGAKSEPIATAFEPVAKSIGNGMSPPLTTPPPIIPQLPSGK